MPPSDLLQNCSEFNKAPSFLSNTFPSDASNCSPHVFFPYYFLHHLWRDIANFYVSLSELWWENLGTILMIMEPHLQ